MGLALATFEGTFESGGPYGDGGYRLKFTVDKIEKLEAVAKPSTDHHPAWVPKDCETSNAHHRSKRLLLCFTGTGCERI